MTKPTKAKEDDVPVEAMPEASEVRVEVTAQAPAKRVSFEQWAARRSVKESHRRGMRAVVTNPDRVRTMAEWDAALQGY